MEENDQLVAHLFDEHPKFRMLYEEHVHFEKDLQKLNQRYYLSPEEEFEKKKVQKLKLAGKDEMVSILRQHSP